MFRISSALRGGDIGGKESSRNEVGCRRNANANAMVMYGDAKLHSIRNERITEKLIKLQTIAKKMQETLFRWYGHVRRGLYK